ncbi:MAG: 3-oxoacyl-ACP reductase FabG [Pseudomonadales bacterium]|nr:3-oxoacyl-ACP reductase FabG [Pseudomonadales bacterium]MBO6564501.1 3-oxoacyl-ACP reductase FabG [Pseudomonadales bacterium]MBO6595374.1 3-oxoacyl-ACP reductase FabG [Pseudomonadales bacterium]MBO6657800.1 3-oxoacyl-ACP reductase FabG [Pseudomonadales bacterium]MBO6701875.1 3-oxoacyl-ACP reductase FabG [Pseudomonadales bacterium]
METKIAIVTGASRGIGKAIARALADAGFTVIGTATSEAGADQISSDLGDRGKGFVLNISDAQSVEDFFGVIKEAYDAPLILVNNAGITKDNIALRMKDDEWQDVIETNLTGLFRVTKPCLRGMTKARWGRIINLTSVVGAMGNAGQSNYAAAKAGIVGYSKSMAAELGSRGITVNCIAPGLIGTDMTDELTEDQRAAMLARIPMGRLGEVSEIADLVVFLAGESAGYITGETIHVNGGMYMA